MNEFKPILRFKEDIEKAYASMLAPYATTTTSKGRVFHEEARTDENRSDFQRDRDRIIHSSAFRRMMYKTQVFVNHEGDNFRTRLTHSLEVSQLARGISKSLALNEDLSEAIALGHDLGHTPFGHASESVFSKKLKAVGLGRFFHNEQSVRVVDFLEDRNIKEYSGLNLTHEVREGMLKHNNDRTGLFPELNPTKPCGSLEGQIVKLVDTLAYTCHDLDDGIKSGILQKNCVENPDIMADFNATKDLLTEKLGITISYDMYADENFISNLIHLFVEKLTRSIYDNILKYNVVDLSTVIKLANDGISVVEFDSETLSVFKSLKKFVTKSVYFTPTVQMMDEKATRVVEALFDAFHSNTKLLPASQQYKLKHYKDYPCFANMNNEQAKARLIVDYISCMTDRFALDEHERVFNPRSKI